ncbi:hypothetical protein M3O96_01260 [Aquiflexum sp. TKW24L]|uniref:hypothetical protein n=1 Tax=Aquiflexum sp. TKW24L TaxID=2942212 RepID=UPI0020BE18C2|nr:hypothetical protein [Aquiflexum sp. TKW24L]MCL6257696.1 hypothetical protein [Aquiflexum sp. TKW24L]
MDTFLIISDSKLVKKEKNIWGDGSWLPSKDREALEWYMIAKMMGWKAEIISTKEEKWEPVPEISYKWIVLACDPETVHPFLIKTILDLIEELPSLLILRKGLNNASWHSILGLTFSEELASGKELYVSIEDLEIISLIKPISGYRVEAEENQSPLILINQNPISIQIKYGKSHLVGLGFNPIEKIDEHPEFFPLIKQILTISHPTAVAWIDWTGTMALRMDDPGSSEIIHHEIYQNTPKLTENQWLEIGSIIENFNAKLSIAYVNGWVDDGNREKGELHIKGQLVDRLAGEVYPSQEVLYLSKKNVSYDYVSEYHCIQKLILQQKAQVETHGFTHLYPDLNSWSISPNKSNDINWFREFGADAMKFIKDSSPENHPLQNASKALKSYWNDQPVVMVFPGETFTLQTQKDALEMRWKMISSYYQAFKIEERFCWTQLVEAPYLDQHDISWGIKECPVVGYFHDFDLSKHGVGWFSDCLENWKECGFKYFIDLRTLLIGYNFNLTLEDKPNIGILHLNNKLYTPDGYPFRIKIKLIEKGKILKIASPNKEGDIQQYNNLVII